jgi:hypothetical protein
VTNPWPPLLTKKQAAEFLSANGFPITKRQFEKLSLPSAADPPRVEAWWGDRALYTQDELLRWARARLRKSRKPRGFQAAA